MRKYSLVSTLVVAVALMVVLSLVSTPAVSQSGVPEGKPTCIGCSSDGKTTPRTADGHPDFSGFWDNPAEDAGHISARSSDGSILFDFAGGQLNAEGVPTSAIAGAKSGVAPRTASQPTYKPEYEAKVKAIDDTSYGVATGLDPMYNCTPYGLPRGAVETMQIVQTPQLIAMLHESTQGMVYRIIYMDGRGHPKDLDTSYMGDSIGHWEGDALVVDVTGLNDDTWLGGGFGGPRNGLIHSDQEHVAERWTRNGDLLNYEATVEDPVMLAKPWVIPARHIKHAAADDYLLETTCNANDKEHIIQPTKDDQFQCNYCASTTKASNVTTIKKNAE